MAVLSVTQSVSLQEEEWQQFQNDLLMTVRVANDFKTEAQHERERLEQENLVLKDKVKMLETEKTKGMWMWVYSQSVSKG